MNRAICFQVNSPIRFHSVSPRSLGLQVYAVYIIIGYVINLQNAGKSR